MATECCNSFGGRITISVNGVRYSARGEISINPTNREVSAGANHDGSVFFTSQPVPYTAQMNFSQPCGLVWDAELLKCALDVTVREDDSRRTHFFGRARWVGRPQVNLSTGEVTGLSIASQSYRKVEDN